MAFEQFCDYCYVTRAQKLYGKVRFEKLSDGGCGVWLVGKRGSPDRKIANIDRKPRRCTCKGKKLLA